LSFFGLTNKIALQAGGVLEGRGVAFFVFLCVGARCPSWGLDVPIWGFVGFVVPLDFVGIVGDGDGFGFDFDDCGGHYSSSS